MTNLKRLTSLTMLGLLIGAGPVYADAVTYWNGIAQPAIAAGRPGAPGALDSALVQIAVHDAVQALDKRFEPYHVIIKDAKGSQSAAVAAAAHDVLVGLYPDQTNALNISYYGYLSDNGLTGDPGLDVGHKAAAAVLTLARKIPVLVPPFVGSNEIGHWRPTDSFIPNPPGSLLPFSPPRFSPMLAPLMNEVAPFTFTNPARFRPGMPPAVTSDRYTKEYNEVKTLGAFASTALTTLTRTPEQTDIAYFYSENAISQWNRALRGIAEKHLSKLGDSARLFALANMAMADAIITAWDSKKYYFYWRPLTAIQEGETDGNPQTAGDPAWQPLINNPNYPDYISGANSIAGSITRTLQLFFRTDNMTFDVTSVAPKAIITKRTYNHFSDGAQDVVNARIYLGIHFRTADEVARTQSRRVAQWVYRHVLLPLDD